MTVTSITTGDVDSYLYWYKHYRLVMTYMDFLSRGIYNNSEGRSESPQDIKSVTLGNSKVKRYPDPEDPSSMYHIEFNGAPTKKQIEFAKEISSLLNNTDELKDLKSKRDYQKWINDHIDQYNSICNEMHEADYDLYPEMDAYDSYLATRYW